MFDRSPKRVMHELIETALMSRFCDSRIRGSDVSATIRAHVESGQEVPERLKPGWLLRNASEDKLEALRALRSEDLENDWPGLLPPESRIIR